MGSNAANGSLRATSRTIRIRSRQKDPSVVFGAAFVVSSVVFALFAAISMAFEMGWKIPWPASCENLL
jgi:hypothetical protein